MNKRGGVVLRDILFILLIMTSLLLLASTFVSEMAITYGDTNMSSEYASGSFQSIASESFYETTGNVSDTAKNLDDPGILSLVGGALTSAGSVIKTVFLAPYTFSKMIEGILVEVGVNETLTNIIGITIMASIYILIIFTIITAFLKGGKI